MPQAQKQTTPPANAGANNGDAPALDASALEAMMQGRPAPDAAPVDGDGAEDTTQDGGLVEVSVKGRKVKMTKEAAEAFEEFRREGRERDGRLGGEIARLREEHARLAGTVDALRDRNTGTEDDLPKPPPPELAREDFAEYHRQMLAYNAAMMVSQQRELEGRYDADQKDRSAKEQKDREAKSWVEKFYADHPHLAKPHVRPIVQSVFFENAKEINGYGDDVDGAHTRLAELAEERLVLIKQDGKEIDPKKPPRLEGAGTPAPKPAKETAQPVKRLSAAEWQRRERARLRGEALSK
jgi:hypothetical protein